MDILYKIRGVNYLSHSKFFLKGKKKLDSDKILPAKASRSVDLPLPEGPITAKSCPGLAWPVRP